MNSIYTLEYASPFGELIVGDYDNRLCLLDWKYRAKRKQIDERIAKFLKAEYIDKKTPLHSVVIRQLEEYFRKERSGFDIPLLLAGSPFQQKVWQQLSKISYGKTISYLELSQQLGDKKAIRAVAAANGANAISIVVPCHRVIGGNGELVGYAGGIGVKQQLLKLEGTSPQLELNYN